MEVDYIRRKPLITVTVEVEVGGEGFLVPVWVCVSVLTCASVHALPRASVNSYFSTCMLFFTDHTFPVTVKKKKKGKME